MESNENTQENENTQDLKNTEEVKNTEEIKNTQELESTNETIANEAESNKDTNESAESTNEINSDTKESSSNTNDKKGNAKHSKDKPKKNGPLKIISTAFNIVVWTLIVITLAILLLTVASRKTDVFGYRLYLIMSGSMEPVIHVKDAIVTKEIDEPQVGDVIAFENGDMITVHRIIKVYTEGDNRLYQTKGDNNNSEDPGLVQKSQVKGKVVCTMTALGNIIYYIQTHFVVMIIAIGIVIMIILVRRLL